VVGVDDVVDVSNIVAVIEVIGGVVDVLENVLDEDDVGVGIGVGSPVTLAPKR
jgi:hypothetical protein